MLRYPAFVALPILIACFSGRVTAVEVYSTDFEDDEGYLVGPLGAGGSNGWIEVQGSGSSGIVDTVSYSGEQSLEVAANAAVERSVTSTENTLYVEGRYDPPLSDHYPTLPVASPGSAFFIFHSVDGLVGLDGDGSGGGTWVQAGGSLGVGFHRITVRLTFTTQTWDLWVDGQAIFAGFGFKDSSVIQLNGLRVDSSQGAAGYLDSVVIGTDPPDFLVATPTVTSTPSPSSTVTRTPTPTTSLSPTASASATRTATGSLTATRSHTSTNTMMPSATRTPSASSTATPSTTSSASQTASPSETLVPSVTVSESPTSSTTRTPEITSTETDAPTGTPTQSESETLTATSSPEETATPTSTSTETGSPTETSTPTETQFGDPTSTETLSPTPTRTPVDPNQVDHFLFQFAMQFQEIVDQGNEMFEQPEGDGQIAASDLLYWLALLKGN